MTWYAGLDRSDWRASVPLQAATAAGFTCCYDLRNNEDRHHQAFILHSATSLFAFNPRVNALYPLGTPALAGTFGAGACSTFAPSQGPRGTLAAGCTTSILTTTTTWTIGANIMINRGNTKGFKIRVIDSGTGGSGRIAERYIVKHTGASAGTIQIWLDSPLPFTPVVGSKYEILSGKAYFFNAGTIAAGIFKSYDVLLNTFTSLATTGAVTQVAGSRLWMLDELYVPYNRLPGEGYFGVMQASAAGASSLTGPASGDGSNLYVNAMRNFNIRIVEDTVNVTAVGQRRLIQSHTAGASPVFTLSTAWTVTPSASAKFVIENNGLLLNPAASGQGTYTYNPTPDTIVSNAGTSIPTDSWASGIFASRGATAVAGASFVQSFGLDYDLDGISRFSNIFAFRGGALTLDILDIAASATGTWTLAALTGIPATATAFTTGTSWCYAPQAFEGKFLYCNVNAGLNNFRFSLKSRTFEEIPGLVIAQGAALDAERMFTAWHHEGSAATAKQEIMLAYSTGTSLLGNVVML